MANVNQCSDFLSTFWKDHGVDAISAVLQIVIILAAYFAVRFIVINLIDRSLGRQISRVGVNFPPARQARLRALQSVLRSCVGIVLGFAAVIMILDAVGIDPSSLLVSASVVGLAVGFGAQKLVRDVVTGILILIEDQYGVGDFVTIGSATGVVEELSLRTTRIRDNIGKLYILSNGDIAQVCNHSRGKLCSTLDVAVSAVSDIEKIKHVLNEVGVDLAKEMPSRITEAFKCEGLTQITGTTATIRLVGGVVAEYQDDVQMTLNERIRDAFEKNGIQLA